MFRLALIVILSLIQISYAQNVLRPDNMSLTSYEDLLKLLQNNTLNVNDAQICESPRRCVPHYQCLENGTFNIRGIDVVSPRFGDDESNKLFDGDKVYEVSAHNTITLRSGTEAPLCGYLDQCCGTEPISKIDLPVNSKDGCGYRNPDGLFFKINDTDKAQYCEFPWMAAVIWNHPEKNKPSLVGGGSIIHPSVILSAAHILDGRTAKEFKVRGGEWDTQTINENLPYQERNVKQIIQHKNFEVKTLLNDFVLLVVDEPFVLGPNIQPICLPTENLIFDDLENCYSAGWGKEKFSHKERRQTIMKRVQLPIVPFEKCEEQLRNTQVGDIFELHESFTCAGGKDGKDTCTGDGGSPLMCEVYNQPNRYYQTGIVSWGLGCGQDNVPGVYANVGFARNWIDEQMTVLGFGTESYSIR